MTDETTHLKNFTDLKGHVLAGVETRDEEAIFTLEDGAKYMLHHSQDCCENVYLADVVGDVDTLVGSPILMADESSNSYENRDGYESVTWTFYNLATVKGCVTLLWCGSSNGYYSESVYWVSVT